MSSSRRQQQQESQLGKLRSFSGTLTFILFLVGFSFLVYLRSFLALNKAAILPSSSFGLESWPIAVVIGSNPHRTTLENVSSTPLPDHHRTTLQNVSSTPLPDHQLHPQTPNSSLIEEEELQVQLDLEELLTIVAASKRRRWLKQHWAEVRVLQSDPTSERFEKRVRGFLRSSICSHTFFTIWISTLEAYGEREKRCMESIFKHHPRACVIIVSRSLDCSRGTRLLKPFTDLGLKLMAAAPDLPFLFSETPAQVWLRDLKKGRVDPGEISFKQNLSNILRMLLLYKFGGIYLDSDVLVLNSFSNLSNAIGAQSEEPRSGEWLRVNNAVLVFERKHPVILSFIKEFALTFNGSKWGHNGPYLATRVLMRQRGLGLGLGCEVVRTRGFYPVSWGHIPGLFKRPASAGEWEWKEVKVRRLMGESYCIHLWNRETRVVPVEPGSVIDELFKEQCVLCEEAQGGNRVVSS